MSAHVLLNLFNELGKRDKMRGLSRIAFFFAKSDIKITCKLYFWREHVKILPSFTQRYNGRHNVMYLSANH